MFIFVSGKQSNTRKQTRLRKLFLYSIFLVNALAAFALGLSYLSIYINPEKSWIPALFGLAYPYILTLNIAFVIFWVVFKYRYAILSLAFILLGIFQLGNYFRFSGTESGNTDFRVTSYNVKYFSGSKEDRLPGRAEEILSFLKEKNADIICLQEISLNNRKLFDIMKVKDELPRIKHLQFAHTSQSGGLVTLTLYPIIDMGEIRFEKSGNMVIYTDLQINKDTVRVYNCHLQSYRLRPDDIQPLDSLTFANRREGLKGLKSVSGKVKSAFVKRAKQAVQLGEHIAQSPYPVIVCGDFNDTPVSFTYRMVKGNLKDAFIESGSGFGNTYNGWLPSFRIDYVLHSAHYKGYNFTVDHVDFSDHFPVTCDFVQ